MESKKKQGEIMNTLATRTGDNIKEMAAILASYPAPDKWTQKQKTQAVQFAALLDTAQKVITTANLIGIDYSIEKRTFLENAGKTQSTHTRTAYRTALGRLEAWAERQKFNLLEITAAQADDFIYSLRGRAAASIRLDIAATSSFFTWLERRHTGLKNPFRGTKARPARKAVKKIVIPTFEEVETMIRELPPTLAAAVSIMAFRGLRAGILPNLSIAGNKFFGHSKGHDISGIFSDKILKMITVAFLPLRGPFAGEIVNTLEKEDCPCYRKTL